jgi:hypothetical protein
MVYYRINHPELQVPNKEMIIGEVVHSAIEKYWDNQINANSYTANEIATRMAHDPNPIGTYIQFGYDCLHNYFGKFKSLLTTNFTSETKFKLQIEKDVFVVGKLDRVDDGNVFDWKTARRPLTNIDNNVQFILYNWAFKKMYNAEPSGVYYAALTNGSLVKYNRNPIVEDFLLGEVVPQLVDAIRSKNYIHNGVFRKSCFRCSYSNACLKEV